MSKIYIDPGHGGDDIGADGPTGLHEKDVVLAISKMLGEMLQAGGHTINHSYAGYDQYTSLDTRCNEANNWGADYFISVHLNSDGPEAVGIETLVHKVGTVADKWGKLVQKKMVEATNDRDRGIKYRTDIAVLNGTQMPAILVECGFISHPETEAKFRTGDYQLLLAQAIYDGTQEYLT